MVKDPYVVVHRRYETEKTTVLTSLRESNSNRSVSRCRSAQYVFIVNVNSNKLEISQALEMIYAHKAVRVAGVRTINVKQKTVRLRGRYGLKAAYKKAIVTLQPGCDLD